MNLKQCLLFTYQFLLRFYPCSFRKRFAAEMMQLAAEAEPAEWPLIFGDTSLSIIRSWFEPSGTGATTVSAAATDAYVAIGGSALTASRLIQGLTLALIIVLGITYLGSLGYLDVPRCHAAAAGTIVQ
jgi:hypothetical protein